MKHDNWGIRGNETKRGSTGVQVNGEMSLSASEISVFKRGPEHRTLNLRQLIVYRAGETSGGTTYKRGLDLRIDKRGLKGDAN